MEPRELVEFVARVAHDAVNAYRAGLGETTRAPFLMDDWDRTQALRMDVEYRIENSNAPVSAEHDRWLQRMQEQGWSFGAELDQAAKTHPLMVPFDKLSEEQRRKSYIIQAICAAFIRED
jgi:hypothetical protein